jgi:hypothetical protein
MAAMRPGTRRTVQPPQLHVSGAPHRHSISYNPGEPLAGKWRTWALVDSREMQPPPPPPVRQRALLGRSARGAAGSTRRLSVEQKRIADEWNLDRGSVTPPGVWNRKAMQLVAQCALGHGGDRARVRGAECGDVRCAHRLLAGEVRTLERATGQRHSREARSGLSALVVYATVSELCLGSCGGFQARLPRCSPRYFPEQADEWRAAADEAAMSRLYGGIHFRSDNDEGLATRPPGRSTRDRAQPWP